jgi:hypothetical protein
MAKLFVPPDFVVPERLETEHFRLRMLSAADVDKDYEAVMESQALDPILFQTVKQWLEDCWPFQKVIFPGRQADGT